MMEVPQSLIKTLIAKGTLYGLDNSSVTCKSAQKPSTAKYTYKITHKIGLA